MTTIHDDDPRIARLRAAFEARGHHGGRGARFAEQFGEHGPHDGGRRRHGGFGPGFGPGGGRFGFGPGGPGFDGMGRGGRRARRGDVRLAILGLLAEEPRTGYAIITTIAERTDGAWKPSPGSVYPTLQQLVDEDLVESTGDDRKRQFSLTEAGRTEAEERSEEIAAAWETAPGMSDDRRAFGESLHKAMGVLHMYRSSATDQQVRAAAEKIDELRRDLLRILAD